MPRKQQNEVWKYFHNYEDKGLAICKKCKIKMKNNRVSNLKNHLDRLHNIKLASNIETPASSSSSFLKVYKNKIKIEINKKQLIRSYIGLVTEDFISFNVLNSPNMKYIMMPICEGLRETDGKQIYLNAQNCIKTLQLVANNIKSDITSELKYKLLSLKIDSATRLYRNIFSISAQYISDGLIKSHILGMVELKGFASSTSKNLAVGITKILKKYEISLKQILSVTSDNGANMLKAAKILPLVSEEDFEENEADSANDEYLKKIKLVEDIPDISFGNIPVGRCAAHIAQLCALDVIKSPALAKYLFTSRNLTKYIRKTSNGYRDIFKTKHLKMPQLDCPTRWGSTYILIENLKEAKDVLEKIESLKTQTQDENFEIDETFWEFIDAYCLLFNPLQKTIKIFQEEHLHYGSFYAQWLKCKICTEQIIKNANQPLTKTIGRQILQSFEKRTNTLMQNDSLKGCLYLDPRFHHSLTAKQKLEATKYLKLIWDRINEINPEGTLNLTPILSAHQPFNEFADPEEELLNEYISRGVKVNIGNTTDVYTKIQNIELPFLRSDTNVLSFWREKQFTDSELYILSCVCFAIPATQVTIEGAFSALKMILTEYGNHLSEETLENILLVKLNQNYLDAAIENLPLFEEDGEI